jgi:Tol biopolymer transport system component
LFLMNLDGSNVTPVQYTLDNLYSPSISADLKKIAFVSFPNVYVVNSDGTGQKQLTTYTDSSADSFSFVLTARISPNGKKIIYSVGDGSIETFELWIMNADGTDKKNLSVTPPTGMTNCFSGSFSADSRKITFGCWGSSGNGIFVANADGTHQSTIVPPTNAFLDSPMFSPDGKKILFVGFGFGVGATTRQHATFSQKRTFASMRASLHSHGFPAGTQGVFSIDLDGTGAVLVAANAFEAEILNSTLYYSLFDSELGFSQIWKSNLDGTAAVTVSDGTADDRLALEFED